MYIYKHNINIYMKYMYKYVKISSIDMKETQKR